MPSARPKHLGSPANQALEGSRSGEVIGAYRVKATKCEATSLVNGVLVRAHSEAPVRPSQEPAMHRTSSICGTARIPAVR